MTTYTWSEIAARGNNMKVPTINRPTTEGLPTEKVTIYERPDLQNLMKVHRAEGMLGMALHDDTVLFELPVKEFTTLEDSYETLRRQIGTPLGARIIRPNNKRPTETFMLEARFEEEADMEKAISQGVIIGEMAYRAIITRTNTGALPKMVRVHAAGIPFADKETLTKNLLLSLGYYGNVCQIQILRRAGMFEGVVSVLLDTDPNVGKFEPLQRMIYLEAWKKHVPANFKGQPPVCYHCRQSNHLKKDCPELLAIKCFRCGHFGHISRHCKEDPMYPRKTSAEEEPVMKAEPVKKQKTEKEEKTEKTEKEDKKEKDQTENKKTEKSITEEDKEKEKSAKDDGIFEGPHDEDNMSSIMTDDMTDDTDNRSQQGLEEGDTYSDSVDAVEDTDSTGMEVEHQEESWTTTDQRIYEQGTGASQYAPGSKTMQVDNKQEMIQYSTVKPNTKRKASQSSIPISSTTSQISAAYASPRIKPSVLSTRSGNFGSSRSTSTSNRV
jgi:hypothetical protein